MTPVDPCDGAKVLDAAGVEGCHVTYAATQPEYLPLPAVNLAGGRVLTEWQLTDAERSAIAAGANLRLWVWTFNRPLQPIALQVVGVEEGV